MIFLSNLGLSSQCEPTCIPVIMLQLRGLLSSLKFEAVPTSLFVLFVCSFV